MTVKLMARRFIRRCPGCCDLAPNRVLQFAMACLLGGFGAVAAAAQSAQGPSSPNTPLAHLTLHQAEILFAERNRELNLAQRAVESAEADILSAGARPNPTLGLATSQISPSAGIGGGSIASKRVDTVVSVSQLFERGGKRELREGVARFNAEAVQGDRTELERQQRVALHGAYYDLLLAQEKVQISTGTAGAFQNTIDAAQIRLKSGDIAPSELARIHVDALRAQNDARLARSELEKAQLVLGYLIGAEREAGKIRAADEWPRTIQGPSATNVDALLGNHAAVRAAQARLGAAEKNRELSRSLRTRDVTAGLQYEHYPADAGSSANSYGFFVAVPLFTGYYYDGEIRRAETELLAAQTNLERVRATVLAEITRIRSDLEAAAERVKRFNDILLVTAEKAAKGAEFAYSRGALGIMDLLDARRQFYATQLESAAATAEYAKAAAAWRLAVTPSPVPEKVPASTYGSKAP